MPRDVAAPTSAVHAVVTGGVNTGKTRLALALAGFDARMLRGNAFRTVPSSLASGAYVATIGNQVDGTGLSWSVTDTAGLCRAGSLDALACSVEYECVFNLVRERRGTAVVVAVSGAGNSASASWPRLRDVEALLLEARAARVVFAVTCSPWSLRWVDRLDLLASSCPVVMTPGGTENVPALCSRLRESSCRV